MGVFNLNFSHDKPLFGLDIGHSNIKVMQLHNPHGKAPKLTGYGISSSYPTDTIAGGAIVNFERLATVLQDLFKTRLTGTISTRRVACTVPTSHTFSRPMKLPAMDEDEIAEAVQLEVEQYVPVPKEKLYIDYDISRNTKEGIELLMVATPKNIIDSYLKLLELLKLEPIAFEPSMNAAIRLFRMTDATANQPTILIDLGSVAVDIAVFDQTMFVVNSTVAGGGETITSLIAKQLGVNVAEAENIKRKYGISYSDKLRNISSAIKPLLDALIREIRKIIRYYEDRSAQSQRKITQIITMGGGSNLHGLSEYLSRELNLPVRILDSLNKLDFGSLPPPADNERAMYITVAGEASLTTREILGD